MSAEFEALMGKNSNLVSFYSHAFCQQDRLQTQGWILGKDNEAVASGPSFSEIRWPSFRALHHCLVEKVMYHSIATEALKEVICFSKWSKDGKMCQRRQLSSVQLQNFTNFCSFRMYLTLLNLVHKLKCETSLTLLSTKSHFYLSQWRYFGAYFWELAPKF